MSEIEREDVPIPIVNYIQLIRERKSPYYDIIHHLLQDMKMHYEKFGNSEVVYTINPRLLQEEIEKKIKNEKLTNVNICRSILALLYGSKLKEEKDFYITTTSRGRRNYHIKIDDKTLSKINNFLFTSKFI